MIYLVLGLGLILRLFGLNQSLWLDEAASVEIASTPLANFMAKMSTDFHPPFYYLLLKAWMPLAGQTEWLLRLPSVIFGLLTIYFLYRLVLLCLPKHHQQALLSALILSVSQFHLYYSQELRMYSLNTFLAVLSWYLLLKASQSSLVRYAWLFFVVSTLNLYTFYGSIFCLATQIAYLGFCHRHRYSLWLASVGSLLAFGFCLPLVLSQLSNSHTIRQLLPGWSSLSGELSLKSLILLVIKLFYGRVSFYPKPVYFSLAALTSLSGIALILLGWFRLRLRPLFFWVTGSLVMAFAVAFSTPLLGYWRFNFILPAIAALISAGIMSIRSQRLRWLVASTYLLLSFSAIAMYHLQPHNQREDWRGLSQHLTSLNLPTLVSFPDPFSPLKFYAPHLTYLTSSTGYDLPSHQSQVVVLDYLSDLTDPQRSQLSVLADQGFVLVSSRSFNGLGEVSLYQRR